MRAGSSTPDDAASQRATSPEFPDWKLVLATRNPGKVDELRTLLADLALDLVGLDAAPPYPEPEETGTTFADNALLKARAAVAATGWAAAADDSGLCVDALGGAPGVLSARFAGAAATDADNNRLLMKELDPVADDARGARYWCAAALCLPGGFETVVEGSVEGRILRDPRGTGGFGYDPYFWYEPFAATFAEVELTRKNQVSHRAQAFRALAAVVRARLIG